MHSNNAGLLNLPKSNFFVITVLHEGNVLVLHDTSYQVYWFVSTDHARSFIVKGDPAQLGTFWPLYAPRAVLVDAETLQRSIVHIKQYPRSYKISSYAGMIQGYELDLDAGFRLFVRGSLLLPVA